MLSLKVYLYNLNLFESVKDGQVEQDEHQRHTNIIATRIYLGVLGLLLISVAILLWISPQTTMIKLDEPTIDQFKILPFEAKCSCSRVSISYGDFITHHSRFHQICSSDFVTDRWIKAVNMGITSNHYNSTDFRASGSAQFQALAGFCDFSKADISRGIATFDITTLISPKVLSEINVQSQTRASFDPFRLAAPSASQMQLNIISQMNKQFLSGLQSNFYMQYYTESSEPYVFINSVSYEDVHGSSCNCFGIGDCHASARIYGNTSEILTFTIPGFVVGCLPVSALLLSTLECLYNQTCVDTLISYFPTNNTFTALEIVEKSLFVPNSAVKSIVDHLMLEEWVIDVSYSKYYNQCAPKSCTYSKVERNGSVFILTKLISLLSGLVLVLMLLIPAATRFVRRPQNHQPSPKVLRKLNIVQETYVKSRVQKMMIRISMKFCYFSCCTV